MKSKTGHTSDYRGTAVDSSQISGSDGAFTDRRTVQSTKQFKLIISKRNWRQPLEKTHSSFPVDGGVAI